MSVVVEVLEEGVVVQELEAESPVLMDVLVDTPVVVEVIERGPQGADGADGEQGPPGPAGEFAGTPVEVFEGHVNATDPHPAYDDLPSLSLLFENGLI